MVRMLVVVLDTNAVHSDPWLASPPGKKLLDLAASGSCVVVYPQVVIDELLRQRREAADRAHSEAAKGVGDMAKSGVDVRQTIADLEASFAGIGADLLSAFGAVLKRDNVTAEPVPDVAATEILKRDLARRRPFIEIDFKQKPASVGFRDTLIWETVLAILARDNERKILFVTADKGFLSVDSKTLHQHLLEDLDERGIGRNRVGSVKNVPHAIAEVEAADHAALVTAATDALYELADREISQQMGYGGDYDYPDFVKFEVPAMEGGSISYIDQTTEFEFARQPGSVAVTATADALIYIEGPVFKGDWFIDGGESMSLSGELNDHYFEASSEIAVRVVVELDTSGDSPQALSIQLEDLPSSSSGSEETETA